MNGFRISKLSIMALLVYFSIFVRFYYLQQYPGLRNIALCLLIMYIGINYKSIKLTSPTNISLFLFVILNVVFSFINIEYTSKHINNLVVFSVSLIIVFLFFEIVAKKGKLSTVFDLFYRIHLVVLIINDFLLFTNPDLVIVKDGYYMMGNKFTVSYAHLLLIVLYFARNMCSDRRLRRLVVPIGLFVWSFNVIYAVGCYTGLVGLVFLGVIVGLLYYDKAFVVSRKIIFILLGISIGFVVGYGLILNQPFIQHIVQDVMGHSMTLSGRINIFNRFPSVIKGHWAIGFGYGTSYSLGMTLGGFPDTQNGILEWLWQAGLIGLIPLLFLIYTSLQDISEKRALYFAAFIEVLVIMSTVEITIDQLFLSVLAIIYGISMSDYYEKKSLRK